MITPSSTMLTPTNSRVKSVTGTGVVGGVVVSLVEGISAKISFLEQAARHLMSELRELNAVYKKYVDEIETLGLTDIVFDDYTEEE